ncbi:MAG: hypothetical protein ACKV0T_05820 [Planctomycetales bacterium]
MAMIAKSPRERELYEARLKMQRDEAARLKYSMEEGLAKGHVEGRVEGRLIGQIQLLQQLLGLSESPTDELAAIPVDQLSSLFSDLQTQRRERN